MRCVWRRVPAWVWLVPLWAVLFLPQSETRAFYFEEGRNFEMATSIATGDPWLEPHIHGDRFVEKPTLLPWILVLLHGAAGGLNEFLVRLPSLLATLAGAFVCYRLIRPRFGAGAGLFAGMAFLLIPHVMEKAACGEPDPMLMVFSFAAFLVWWNGVEPPPDARAEGAQRMHPEGAAEIPSQADAADVQVKAVSCVPLWRWGAAGLLLVLIVLAKGPQLTMFFLMGTGLYTLLQRRWRDIPGYALCAAMPIAVVVVWGWLVYTPGDEETWMVYMRLDEILGFHFSGEYVKAQVLFLLEWIAESLPWFGFAGVAWVWCHRDRTHPQRRLAFALALFAFACTAVLTVWPEARPRYAMSAYPAMAVMAAFLFPGIWRRRVLRVLLCLTVVGMAGFWVYWTNIEIPSRTGWRHGQLRASAWEMNKHIGADGLPLLLYQDAHDTNTTPYLVKRPLLIRPDPEGVDRLPAPAWVLSNMVEPAGMRAVPGVVAELVHTAPGPNDGTYFLYRIEPLAVEEEGIEAE